MQYDSTDKINLGTYSKMYRHYCFVGFTDNKQLNFKF